MRKLFFLMLVVACAFATGLLGQITDPTQIVLEIKNPKPDDARLRVKTPGHLTWTSLDSVFRWVGSTTATLETYTENREIDWHIKVVGIDSAQNRMTLEVTERGPGRNRRTWEQIVLWQSAVPVMNDSILPGIAVIMDTVAYIGDETNLFFTYTEFATASIAGAMGTFSDPIIDSLTILALDTLYSAEDTFYTDPVPGNQGFMTMLIETIPITSTGTRFGLGYQVKYAGASNWFGDLEDEGHLFILSDSLFMGTDSLRAARVQTIPADSTRFAIYGKSALRAILKKVKILWRD